MQIRFTQIMCAYLVLFSVVGFALTEDEVASMILLEQETIAEIAVGQTTWFSDGDTVAMSGKAGGMAEIVAYPGPDGETWHGNRPANVSFGVAPLSMHLAYWRRVGDDTAELTVVKLKGPSTSTLGQPQPVTNSMPLAWLSESQIIYADNAGDTARLFVRDLSGGEPVPVTTQSQGIWQELTRRKDEGIGAILKRDRGIVEFDVNATDPGTVDVIEVAGTEARPLLEIDRDGNLIFNHGTSEGVIIDTDVVDASLAPDRSAVLYVSGGTLYVSPTSKPAPRLVGAPAGFEVTGCSWSPAGSNCCFWGRRGGEARAYFGLLGTETVTGRFALKTDVDPAVGDILWVAEKFFTNDFGSVEEPDWSTLKAQFVITRVLRGADRIIVEAKSTGRQPDVVERITGSASPENIEEGRGHINIGTGSRTQKWLETFTARVRPELAAWLQGTHSVADILTISVQRRVLLPVGPAQATAESD